MIKSNKNMKLYLSVLFGAFCISANAMTPPDSTNVAQKTKIEALLFKGKQDLYAKNYRAALEDFRGVLRIDKDHPLAHYRVAECQIKLRAYTFAIKHLKQAYEKDPEVNKEYFYTLGTAQHRVGKLDDAGDSYKKFNETLTSDSRKEEYDIDLLIAQVEFAKKMMAAPTKAKTENFRDLNTRYREYGATMAPDGKTIYFTARRNDTKGGGINEGDQAYYSDIYQSVWDEENDEWAEAENLEGKINTEMFDEINDLRINEDGTMEIYVTVNFKGWTKSSDIGVSKLSKKGTWGQAKLLPKKTINTSYFESSCSFTEDGQTMFFVSNKPVKGKGFQKADIYMSKKEGNKWSEPVNLGENINTKYDEIACSVTPDGKYLFFSSRGHDNMGGYDVFISKYENGEWTKARNLGYPINSVDDDLTFKLYDNNTKALMTSVRENGKGQYDIYKVDLSEMNIFE